MSIIYKGSEYNPVYGNDEGGNDEKEKQVAEATKPSNAGNDAPKEKKSRRSKKDTEKTPKKRFKPFAFVQNRRFKLVFGTALTLFAVLLMIASFSYIKNGAADQSLVETNSILANAHSGEIKNDVGSFGAAFAETFFNKGFGVGSYFLIVMIFLIGLKCFGKYKARLSSTIAINILATITFSSIAGLLTLASEQSFFLWGGEHGKYLNEFLISLLGTGGAIAVNILLIVSLIALCLNSILRIVNKYRRYLRKRRQASLEAKQREEEELLKLQKEKEEEEKFKSKNIQFGEEETNPLEKSPVETNSSNEVIYSPSETSATDEIPIFEEVASEVAVENETVAEETIEAVEIPAEPVKEKPAEPVQTSSNTNDVPMTIVQNQIEEADKIQSQPFDPTAELSRYKFPTLDLLKEIPADDGRSVDIKEQEENKERITKTLNDYGIEIRSIEVCVGPTVTLYEIIPAEGVRIAKIKHLEDDIAMSLAAMGIRIIAPIPGKGTIGIEVPNKDPKTVWMRSIIGSKKFQECNYELPIALGSTIENDVFVTDLAKMPHVLVAGATGQGKSVGLNVIITSLLYKKHPSELKFVMIDPKMVEFSLYAKLEHHYIAKLPDDEEAIVTNMTKAVATLNALVQEMENRYELLKMAEVRNIKQYNEKFVNRRLNPENGHKFLPYIVVVVDEFADLIMVQGKEVETPIARLAQKARAIGIHVIIATQRPSTNVITGLIKNNFPARIAFRVTQMVDSRTIIDRPGANQLIGRGDMLISQNNELTRVQCAFVDTPEVEAITKYIQNQIGFDHAYELPEYEGDGAEGGGAGNLGSVSDRDPLFYEAAEFIVGGGQTASTSSIQRHFSIGYPRAGKIMDQMEAAGIVGPASGGKPRQVLIDMYQLNQYLNK